MESGYKATKTRKVVIESISTEIVRRQRNFFNSGSTRPVSFRIEQLKLLRRVIQEHENEIMDALKGDLSKPRLEGYISEIAFTYQEIDHTLHNIRRWVKPEKVKTPLIYQPAVSRIYQEPYGVTLIIGPWNYPFQLVVAPLVAAIAAGNTAILKPSSMTPNTSRLLKRLIESHFDSSFITVVEGGADITTMLLRERFDYIFFTGGTIVGKIVMEAATRNLTPVTLELGGKSPAIVAKDADLDIAAKRIAWGKYMNAGQTCIAPDYLLVHESVKEILIEKIRGQINTFYGSDPSASPDYARIINEKHFDRLVNLMQTGRTITGGKVNRGERFIAPTVIDSVSLKDPIMQEEIFGPLLPVLTFNTFEDLLAVMRSQEKPLALYVFTNDARFESRIMLEVPAGGAVVNDVIVHIANPHLPFGGVGESGMGAYHGKTGFDTFTHKKSVMKRGTLADVPFRYPPYPEKGLWFMKSLFKDSAAFRLLRRLVM